MAHDLAKPETLVFWVKPWLFDGSATALDRFFLRLGKSKAVKKKRVHIFVDDPLDYTSLSTRTIIQLAVRAGVELHLIVGVRNTD